MKYNYCPVCGEKLPKHHFGKMCKNCARKEFKKQAVRTALIVGIAAGAGTAAYFYVKNHKKEVANAASALPVRHLLCRRKNSLRSRSSGWKLPNRYPVSKTAENNDPCRICRFCGCFFYDRNGFKQKSR